MTTIVSLATRNCIVIGCDSLATSMKPMIDPLDFMNKFMDEDEKNNYGLKLDDAGKPIFKDLSDLTSITESIPTNQIPNVTKIFHLKPSHIGILVAGISIIGEKSIKNLIDEFIAEEKINKYLKDDYTVQGVSKRLFEYTKKYYEEAFKPPFKPSIEIIVSGYSKRYWEPEIRRIRFSEISEIIPEVKRGKYNIVFGGQYNVIQRIVLGIDYENFFRLNKRVSFLLNKYQGLLTKYLNNQKINIELPKPSKYKKELELYDDSWRLTGISSDIVNFSEQGAIDFVDFLVEVMTKAQQFSDILPTVGGDTHIAIITKSQGFKWISKEEYKYKDYGVPKIE